MKEIILNWMYDYDRVLCPACIADNLQYYQLEFDKWISNPNSKHEYWVKYDDGIGLAFDGDAFVDWLNEYVIQNEEKAYFLERRVDKKNYSMKFKLPVINF